MINRSTLLPLLLSVKGVTFASLDAIVTPSLGIVTEITGAQVLLYSQTHVSGYQNKVRRALEKAGKDPDQFHVGPLPWGERVDNTCLIESKGIDYLQTILLAAGTAVHKMAGSEKEYTKEQLGLRERTPQQGLDKSNMVIVSTYRLENLRRISLLSRTLEGEGKGPARANVPPRASGRPVLTLR